jgi:type VI protein secretion system component VasK
VVLMLGDFLITIVWLFFWTMALMVFISVFSDIFRREDLSGGMKAVWILVVFILPFLGCLIYMIVRPKVTAQDVRSIAQAEAAAKAVQGVSTADELTKLTQLRDAGVISVPQYDALKAKLLADAGAATAATAPASAGATS